MCPNARHSINGGCRAALWRVLEVGYGCLRLWKKRVQVEGQPEKDGESEDWLFRYVGDPQVDLLDGKGSLGERGMSLSKAIRS